MGRRFPGSLQPKAGLPAGTERRRFRRVRSCSHGQGKDALQTARPGDDLDRMNAAPLVE